MSSGIKYKRSEIVLVDFSKGAIGSEQRKIRPSVIIQNDVGNEVGKTIITAAMSSQIFEKSYPTNVKLENGTILLNQIRTIDKKRVLKRLGFVSSENMKKVDKALKISLGL